MDRGTRRGLHARESQKTDHQRQLENKRMLDKSIKDIEKETQGLQAEMKVRIAEIKKIAKQGRMENAMPDKSIRPGKSIRDVEREWQDLSAREKKFIADIKKTAEQGRMENRRLDESMISDIIGKRRGLRAEAKKLIDKLKNMKRRFLIQLLIRDRHHSHCLLRSAVEVDHFRCYGCLEFGIGDRYVCYEQCDYVVHPACVNPKDKLRHPFFPNHDFRFIKEGQPKHRCDACDGDVGGYVYRCFEKDLDLHPCCFNLEHYMLIKEGNERMLLTLHDKELDGCYICGKKRLNSNASRWTYVSKCRRYHFHVACMKKEAIEAVVEGRGLEIGKLANRLSVAGGRSGKAIKFAKIAKILKIAIGFVMAAVFGDPTMLLISAGSALFGNN